MKKFLLLTRILLKTGFGNGMYNDNGKSGRLKKTLFYILIGISLIPFVGLMGYMGYSGYKMFEGLNTGIVLGITCYSGVLLAFFTGMTMCVGIFYNAGDTEFLLPMPFKAEHIVGAKFVTMYVYTLFTDMLFVMPVLAGYGIAGSEGPSYWIMAVITALLIPVTPLVYGSVFTMILIRVFKRARNKDFLTVISGIFVFVVVLVINSFTSSMGEMDTAQLAAVIMEKGTSIMDAMSSVFPNISLAEKALSNENPVMLILFALSVAVFVAVFIVLAKFVYIKSVVEMSDTSSKGKKMTKSELKKAVRKNSQVKSYVIKELKLVFRTPIYFMNCVLMSLIWPVFMMIPMFAQLINGSKNAAGAESGMSLISGIAPETTGGICMVMVFGFTIFSVSFSMMNNTCISREGKNVIFMKYIPMSFEKQLMAKALPGILLTLVTGTVYSVIGMIVAAAVYEITIPPLAAVLSVVISIFTCILFNLIEIISDIIKPKLSWQTEQEAVKQNFVAIIPMFVTMVAGFLIGAGAVMLNLKLDMDVYTVAGIAIAILACLTFLVYKIDVALAKKYFAAY